MGFSSHHVELERGAIVHEMDAALIRRERSLYMETERALYGENQPYTKENAGIPEHLKIITFNDLKSFYYKHYVGANMAFITSGPMTHKDAINFASEKFGHLETGTRNKLIKARFNPSDRFIGYEEKTSTETSFSINYGVSDFAGDDLYNATIAKEILANMMFDELRLKRGLVYGAGSGLRDHHAENPTINLWAYINPEKLADAYDITIACLKSFPERLETEYHIYLNRLRALETQTLVHSFNSTIARGNYILSRYSREQRIIEPYEEIDRRFASVSKSKVFSLFTDNILSQKPAIVYSGDVTSVPLLTGDAFLERTKELLPKQSQPMSAATQSRPQLRPS